MVQLDTASCCTMDIIRVREGEMGQMEAAMQLNDMGLTATLDGEEAPAAILSSESLVWTELTRRDRTFEFSRGLHIRVLEEDGGWAYESDDPELMGFGLTRPDAEQSFCVDFAACWDEIACRDDGALTQDAIELKRKLLALVKVQR